jgi:hypothetical protein
LTQNKKLYIIFGCGIADPHFCNKLIIWGVGGGGQGLLAAAATPTLPAIYVFAFLVRDHKSGSTKSVEVRHSN